MANGCLRHGLACALPRHPPHRAPGTLPLLPTCPCADSNLAFVCDLGNRAAVEKLLTIKRSKGSQRMAILCRNLQARRAA